MQTNGSRWGDKPAHAARSKRQSSMRIGLGLVREAKATGFFTASNTGAAMVTAKMVLGMLSGIDRPGLSTMVPASHGNTSSIAGCGSQC
jgi:phosphate acyltransferase